MTFLDQTDFDIAIRGDQLNSLLQNNGTLLAQAVNTAMDEAVSFITGRYDAAAAFAATGTGRNNLLVSTIVDMALYHLYAHVQARNIPDLRRQRYEEALDLYKGVSKGTRYLNLPLAPVVAGQSTYYVYGSNLRFDTGANIF